MSILIPVDCVLAHKWMQYIAIMQYFIYVFYLCVNCIDFNKLFISANVDRWGHLFIWIWFLAAFEICRNRQLLSVAGHFIVDFKGFKRAKVASIFFCNLMQSGTYEHCKLQFNSISNYYVHTEWAKTRKKFWLDNARFVSKLCKG